MDQHVFTRCQKTAIVVEKSMEQVQLLTFRADNLGGCINRLQCSDLIQMPDMCLNGEVGTAVFDVLGINADHAQQRIEALRNLPLDAPGVTPGTYVDPGNPMTADGGPDGIFARTWVVSAPDTPAIGLKTLTVAVAWTDHSSHQSTISALVRCSTVPCS